MKHVWQMLVLMAVESHGVGAGAGPQPAVGTLKAEAAAGTARAPIEAPVLSGPP